MEWTRLYEKGNNASLGLNWINPSKRVRKELTYSVDNYYKDVLKQPAVVKEKLLNNQL